ncbi:MAG: YeeE/YedE thiosulfate transporter family protein [Eubacteriales bacterium]|nr:YeeE/YedE thiosulfate transporter family protein [Eubacteriales bacterium]
MRKIGFLIFGIIFGFALSRVGASDYNLIYRMFTGENLKLAWVIITAIITAAIGMRILAMTGNKGFRGEKITVKKKALNKFTIFGGIIFGTGWAISGACPGTVLAQIGEGKILGIFTMLGLIAGTYVYALIAQKIRT